MSLPTVLVTGGSGFVGSHLVERLIAAGYRVRCLLRPSSSLDNLKGARIEIARGDIAAGVGLETAVQGARIVFHAAGVTKAVTSAAYYTGNVNGTENLVQACVRFGEPGLRFVLVSSLAAAGPTPGNRPMNEDTAAVPISHYGASKLEAEVRLKHSPLGPSCVIVRPAVVYGPRDTDVFQVFKLARSGWVLSIGRQERFFSVIHARDLAEGILVAALAPEAAGRTYFLANSAPVSWTDFGRLAAELMARRARVIPVPLRVARWVGKAGQWQSRYSRRPGIISPEKIAEARCRYWVCDVSRAKSDLGFEARIPLREGVAETLVWYRDRGWLEF